MKRKRKAEVTVQTLKYLGDLLHTHPSSNSGLYDGLDEVEAELAKKIAEREGRKLIARSLTLASTSTRAT